MTRRRFSEKALATLLLQHEGRCAICSNKIGGAHGRIEWDHIIPLEMGGEDTLENLQPVHSGCHKTKTAKDAGHIAKGRRMTRREAGIPRQPRSVIPGSKGTRWKKRITGEVVPR